MAMDALAQTKWSDKYINDFKDAHVFKKGTNQDYEDEIRYNAAVKIFTPARPATESYAVGGTITYQRLTPGQQVFIVDQRQSWGIRVDSLERHLAKGGGTMWEEEIRGGAWELADDEDDYIRDLMIAGVASANELNARTLGVGAMVSNAYDLMVEMSVRLSDQKVPPGDWHLFAPPAFFGLLKRDERFTGFNTENSRRNIRGNLESIGPIEGFEMHATTNSSVSGSTYTLIACTRKATTYAEQLSELRFIEKTAGDRDERVDSELVFGGKVTRPEGIVTVDVQFAA